MKYGAGLWLSGVGTMVAAAAAAQQTADPATNEEPENETIVVSGQLPRGMVEGDFSSESQLDAGDVRGLGVTSVGELLQVLGPELSSARGRGGEPAFLIDGQRTSGRHEVWAIPSEAIVRVDILPEEAGLRYGFDEFVPRISHLERMADEDSMLPIANRRAFMQRLNWSLGMLKRYKTPATLLYFDLNDFKRINDTFGHAAGDVALRHVVAIVSQCKRSSDFIGRLGGDEFAVVMDFADQAAVEKCAARIAEKISAQPLLLGDLPVTLSVSYGVATLLPEDTLESVLDRADKAMYTHKRAYHAAKAKQSA